VARTTDPALDRLLRRWNLEVDARASARVPASRNRTLVARDARGRRLVVKASYRSADSRVAREGAVLAALGPLPREALALPRLVHSDPHAGAIAVEWVAAAPTLFERRSVRAVRSVGAALAELHRCTERPEGVDANGARDLGFFIRVTPEAYVQLSPQTVQLFGRLQRTGALHALQALQDSAAPQCLLHGDVKRANVLCPRGGGVVLVDWELAHLGDPATDLGSLIADCAVDGAASAVTLGRALLGGYGRDVDRERVVQWAAVALLFYVYGLTQFDRVDGPWPRALERLALGFLLRPRRWARRLQ